MGAVKSNAARLTATELMEGVAPPKRKPSSFTRIMQTQTIQRAYAAVRARVSQWAPPAQRKEQRLGI
jgi:hypothetical protein